LDIWAFWETPRACGFWVTPDPPTAKRGGYRGRTIPRTGRLRGQGEQRRGLRFRSLFFSFGGGLGFREGKGSGRKKAAPKGGEAAALFFRPENGRRQVARGGGTRGYSQIPRLIGAGKGSGAGRRDGPGTRLGAPSRGHPAPRAPGRMKSRPGGFKTHVGRLGLGKRPTPRGNWVTTTGRAGETRRGREGTNSCKVTHREGNKKKPIPMSLRKSGIQNKRHGAEGPAQKKMGCRPSGTIKITPGAPVGRVSVCRARGTAQHRGGRPEARTPRGGPQPGNKGPRGRADRGIAPKRRGGAGGFGVEKRFPQFPLARATAHEWSPQALDVPGRLRGAGGGGPSFCRSSILFHEKIRLTGVA